MIRSSFLASAGADQGGGVWDTDPPSAPPGTPSTYFYGGEEFGFVAVQWANGDPTAWTQIGYNADGVSEPLAHTDSVPAGVTTYETGQVQTTGWWVRHTRGGTPTAWVGPTI